MIWRSRRRGIAILRRVKRLALVLDAVGWHHGAVVAVADGVTLVTLPPYSPGLPPTEPLWARSDARPANRHCADLDALEAIQVDRCRELRAEPATIRPTRSSTGGPTRAENTSYQPDSYQHVATI